MFGEQDFGWVNIATGAALIVYAVFALFLPARLAVGFKAFPRNRVLGMLLTAIGLIWSALYIDRMSLGDLGKYKWLLYVLTPLSFYMIVQYLDDLLAARALGGILMLYPTMLVDSARWIDSPARYVAIVTAYLMVILGIWLILSPFKFRIWTDVVATHPVLRLFSGLITGASGVAMVAIGATIG